MTLAGQVTFSVTLTSTQSTFDMVMNLRIRNNATGVVSKVENYHVVLTEITDSNGMLVADEMSIEGTFFHPTYGYVQVSTTLNFRIPAGSLYPTAGELVAEEVGGGARARLRVDSSTTYVIDYDVDGTPGYETTSDPISWSA